MSKKEFFIVISLGFIFYTILFIRLCFFAGYSLNNWSIPSSILSYALILLCFFLYNGISISSQNNFYVALIGFWFFIAISSVLGFAMSKTYDLSWDGQGYHQTAIIAMANGWNPVYQPDIQLKQKLSSQVFAEGYPSGIWEIQSGIYLMYGKINAAKVLNFYLAVVALFITNIFLRKVKLSKLLSFSISLLIVVHPIFVNQFLTFMQDGLGYQLMIILIFSLILFMIDYTASWASLVFCFAVLITITTKYNMLPLIIPFVLIFVAVYLNNLMNKTVILTTRTRFVIFLLFLSSLVFGYLPYIRNLVSRGTLFYPTNIPHLIGSVKYTNIPSNLYKDNGLSLLFYGIFSKSQSAESGDPESPYNTAELKIPFSTTKQELLDNGALYNNRVGGLGPFFSGLIVLSLTLLAYVSFKVTSQKERYVIYAAYFAIFTIFVTSYMSPTPNLHRYVTQLYLIPFAVVIPLYLGIKSKFISTTSYLLIILVAFNILFYIYSSVQYNYEQQSRLARQLDEMNKSGQKYIISAQQFYSNYNLLAENGVKFMITDSLVCQSTPLSLVSSSETTKFCTDVMGLH